MSFDVFADWWTALRVENMDKFALEKELKAAGIVVMKGGVAITTMREALKAHNNGDGKLPIQEVFTKIDEEYGRKSALDFLLCSDRPAPPLCAQLSPSSHPFSGWIAARVRLQQRRHTRQRRARARFRGDQQSAEQARARRCHE